MPEPPISNSDAVIYSIKAAISAVLALVCFGLLGLPGAIWAPVSAVIVTQPTLHPSLKAAMQRVAANLIGAFIGAIVVALTGNVIWALAVGVLLTGLACHFGRMDDAVRPALAAVVIVTLSKEPHVWAGSLDRVMGVTMGCVVALVVGLIFDRVSRLFFPPPKEAARPTEQGE